MSVCLSCNQEKCAGNMGGVCPSPVALYDWGNDDACENCGRLDCPSAHGGDLDTCQMLQHREGMRVLDDGTEVGGGIGCWSNARATAMGDE